MKPRWTVFFFVTLTGCALPLQALDFRVISWDGEIAGLKYSDGKLPVAIDAVEGSLSSSYHFAGEGPLVLYREVNVEDKIVRIPAATLAAPPGFTQAIILLAYADATRETCTGLWIDDSAAVRPAQTVTYRNLSGHSVAIKIGTEDQVIPPKGTHTLVTDPKVERMIFKAAAQTEAGWKVVASSVQPVRPGLRTLVLLRDGRPDHTGHREIIDLLTFNDYPPPPAPAPRSLTAGPTSSNLTFPDPSGNSAPADRRR